MDFQGINLRKTTPSALRQLVGTGQLALPSKAEGKRLQATIAATWEEKNFALIHNALVLGLHLDAANTFQTLRRKGILRYYGYVGKSFPVSKLAVELQAELSHLSKPVPSTDEQYLASIIQLSGLKEAYATLDARIIQEIASFQQTYPQRSLFKALLAYADSLFLRQQYQVRVPVITNPTSRTKEKVAAAVSFLLHTIAERRPGAIRTRSFISEKYITSGRVLSIVENACLLDDLREAELSVEHFQYRCISQSNGLRLLPPTEVFARSMRLGYIRTELQAIQDVRPETEAASMEELVAQVMMHKELVPFSLATNSGYSRYRLALTASLYDFIAEELFKPDALFSEEIIYLRHIRKEQLLDYAAMTTVFVKDNLTLLDFLKFQRVFHFLYRLFTSYLASELNPDPGLVLRSLLPTFTEAQLSEMLDKFAPTDKVETYLDLVYWEPGVTFLFDLQYHPILLVEQQVMLPMSIIAHSNYLRNLFASEYKRGTKTLVVDGTKDPLVAGLAATFQQAGLKCFDQVKVRGTDVDLLVVYDDTLFLLECKHSLLPVNAFDLRTTYDYLRKAETQLDRLLTLHTKGELIPMLASKCQLDPSRPWRIVPGIMLSNRMFNGNAFRYPVRSFHEMRNFVESGTLHTQDGLFSLWRGASLTVDDLANFFSLDNEYLNLLHQHLSTKVVTYVVNKFRLEKDDYQLDAPLTAYTSTLPRITDELLSEAES